MDDFTRVVYSDQLEAVLSNCGLDPSNIYSSNDGMEALCNALI